MIQLILITLLLIPTLANAQEVREPTPTEICLAALDECSQATTEQDVIIKELKERIKELEAELEK